MLFINTSNRSKQDKPTKILLRDFIAEHKKIIQGQVVHATIIEYRMDGSLPGAAYWEE